MHFDHDKLDYHLHVYHNWFDDYIYAQTLDRYKDFRLVQYTQDKARFYGAEGEIGYQITPIYKISALAITCAVRLMPRAMLHVFRLVV